MSVDLTALLLAAQQAEEAPRSAAVAQLQMFEEQNFAGYVTALCGELSNPQKPVEAQQLAGLMLKNSLYAKEEKKNLELASRWLMLPDEIRKTVKVAVCSTLASPVRGGRMVAALCVGKIASIEYPRKLWPDLVDLLQHNILNAPNNDLKQATFEALGYVCEELPDHLFDKSGGILVAIASGLDSNQTDVSVKLAATICLLNSLEFIKKNMESPQDRKLIMQMILSTTVVDNEQIRMASYLCLCQMARLYYIYLEEFILDIFNLTGTAITKESENVALQAIEFWSTIAEMEVEIVSENEEAIRKGRPTTRVMGNFAGRALQGLLPLILECLTRQEEDADEDSWNRAMAAGCCLGLLAQVVKNAIIDGTSPVLPFIEANIQNPNWHFREAAVMAFGSILDGPDENTILELVKKAFPLMLQQIRDPLLPVRDTVAWTLGRICDICPESIDPNLLTTVCYLYIIESDSHF